MCRKEEKGVVMQEKRMHTLSSAFTMIELIFTILIISIVASIAIPKLSATRDDAKMSTVAQNIMTTATEVAAYAVAKARIEPSFSSMSRATKVMINYGQADDTGNYELDIKWGGEDECIKMKVEDPDDNEAKLTVEKPNTNSNLCKRLQSLIDDSSFPLPLRGSHVLYDN